MADVTLQITIPDAHTMTVLNAFTKASGARIDLNAHKTVGDNDFNSNWNFEIAPQAEGEGAKQFAVRFILELTKAIVKMVDYAEDQDRYRLAVSAIPNAAQDVAEDILTGE